MAASRQKHSRCEPTGEMLVRRMADADHAAMAEFYDRTSALVFGLALRITGEHSIAEDVAVEVYAQVWKQAAAFEPTRGSAMAWLLTVTRSRALDVRRARRRERANEPLEAAHEVCCDRPGPEALSDAAERRRIVQSALATLSGDLRQVIELAYFAGLSHSQIANRLEQPLGTVKTRIRSAMLQLRRQLAQLAPPLALEDE